MRHFICRACYCCYLSCVLSLDRVEAFWGAGLGWLYDYNYERVHLGDGLEGRTPYECGVALGFAGSAYVGLMPVVLLDEIVLDWLRAGLSAVNDVLTHYIQFRLRAKSPCRHPIDSVAGFNASRIGADTAGVGLDARTPCPH
jgi:hypothetical protein